jgi:hypothetical protein
LWLLLDGSGRTVVNLNLDAWDTGQLEDLRKRLELPLTEYAEALSPAELRSRFPGGMPWWVAHPLLSILLGIALILAIMVAVTQ